MSHANGAKPKFRKSSSAILIVILGNKPYGKFEIIVKEPKSKWFECVTCSWQRFMNEQICFDWCNLNRHWKMFQSVPWISVMYTTIKSRCGVPQSTCGSRGLRQLRQQATWASIDCVYVEQSGSASWHVASVAAKLHAATGRVPKFTTQHSAQNKLTPNGAHNRWRCYTIFIAQEAKRLQVAHRFHAMRTYGCRNNVRTHVTIAIVV